MLICSQNGNSVPRTVRDFLDTRTPKCNSNTKPRKPQGKIQAQHQQLTLLTSPKPALNIELVPPELKTAKRDRFYITASEGGATWRYPLQFDEWEIETAFPLIQDLDWSLNEEGVPQDADAIHRYFEWLVDVKLPQLQRVQGVAA